LYIVATPIGNLGDLSARAIETLKSVAVIACEDTRVTGGLLHRFGIATPMMAYHDHNADQVRPKILQRLGGGDHVALVSDAGTPLISDPGFKLVASCAEAGLSVVPIPGPSAPLAALMAAGLPTDQFYFGGFLPPKSKARQEALERVRGLTCSLVFFESPHRIGDTLADMAQVLGDRLATVARELTKLHEEFRRGSLSLLAEHYAAHETKGEIVIVVAGSAEDETNITINLDEALIDALKTMSVRDAAEAVAKLAGVSRREAYGRALSLSSAKDEH
jgi:16S rRNA (cytidine1402-2'-O)-methyltransferase